MAARSVDVRRFFPNTGLRTEVKCWVCAEVCSRCTHRKSIFVPIPQITGVIPVILESPTFLMFPCQRTDTIRLNLKYCKLECGQSRGYDIRKNKLLHENNYGRDYEFRVEKDNSKLNIDISRDIVLSIIDNSLENVKYIYTSN